MADSKITALAALTAADPVNDMFPVVDVSDTSMAASGTTKRISANNILSSSPTASGALTVTGLVTAGSATITGDLTVDTSTLKVDSTNNRVGIGTASPSQPLHVRFDNAGPTTVALFENGIIDFSSSAAGQIVVGARGYNNTVLRQNPDIGTTPTIGGVLDTILANTYVAAGQGKVILATQSTARLTVHESSGDVSIANGNLVMATSGKGIDFSATSGTGTSELLADYEEGTFTATLKGGTTDPTIAVTTTGKYTKIGRQVFVRIQFGNASTVGASGTISVTGLPFTSASGDDQIGYLMVENMATFTNSSLSSYLPPSSSTLSFYTSTSNSVVTQITHNAGVARYLWATITYTV